MPGRKTKLGCPKVAAVIDALHAKEPDGWRKNRLLAVKLAAKGEFTSDEIADLCGVSRTHIYKWFKIVREGGLDALLEREKPGPKEGSCRGIAVEVLDELEKKLKANDFVTVVHAQRWLEQKDGVKRPYNTVWVWLKKLGGVLLVPRPSHSKKDPAASEAFRNELGQRLEALKIPAGSKVKIWVMDEARFGLHTEMRRLWSLKGQRPVVTRQIKYEWDYLYGSLDVVSGQAHFCQFPSINLEWDFEYLSDLTRVDSEAIHIVIRDQAGFHLRDGDSRLPPRVRIIDLPPYSPELNPCEQLWDIVKDDIGNRVFQTIEELRDATLPTLKRYWDDAAAVLRLIGREWILIQVNGSKKILVSH
jgi:transposase